jgi:hypothetical protein
VQHRMSIATASRTLSASNRSSSEDDGVAT